MIKLENDTIVILLGFVVTLIGVMTPIVKLNSSITKLNVTMEATNKIVGKIDDKVENHEVRLVRLEERK